ncbi:hypothetical protein [Soonwooa sp.]|uniref:hypothetical protein n=1 Tax=Soonwooa sp. TaxID=1938592 RepID=UPI00260A2AF6|nr:hypothetical protein [Soonwooa sp.]
MLFTEDLGKSLALCMLRHKDAAEKLSYWCHEIDRERLSEREAYQKKTEVLLLSALLQHYPDIEIENLTGESPDFIVKINGRRIGLEISEVINHFEKKKQEAYINQLFRYVEDWLLTSELASGIYHIGLDSQLVINSYQEKVVKDICNAVKHQKSTKYVTSIRRTPYDKGVLLVLDYSLSLFDELRADKILHAIEKKNIKYPLYKSKVDECWLVLVSNMHNMSSRYSYIQTPEILKTVSSPFEKILHLENLYSEMLRIK